MKRKRSNLEQALRTKEVIIAEISLIAIAVHLVLRFGVSGADQLLIEMPLFVGLACGFPLIAKIVRKMIRLDITSDLLAGISIVTAVLLGEYLAGTIVVLMLASGQALEDYAVRKASFALEALAKRLPSVAHRKDGNSVVDISLAEVSVGDELIVFPHETCPADGTVLEGHSTMNEAYLTGEPYLLPKVTGSAVLSGAINGEGALTIKVQLRPEDSRYAKIMQVMRESEELRPTIRRLGDQIGAVYMPVTIAISIASWYFSGDVERFLSVLVVATPCPLIIGIPVAVVGAVSLAAKRGIIIKDPSVLEKIDTCSVAIFDKTGTLTYGEPKLTEILTADGVGSDEVLSAVASLECYSRHPLSSAIKEAASERRLALHEASAVSESPGTGLSGVIRDRSIRVTSRKKAVADPGFNAELLPPHSAGLECIVLFDGKYAATFRFRDEPRAEGRSFVRHLGPKHGFGRVLLVSGDRETEVGYLAEKVGITEVHAGQSPEQKLELVRHETRLANTVFMGDGINDAPALTAATVGIAFGQASDVTAEAAGAVILDSTLERVDELMHIGRRMRVVALQSAVGGVALSLIGIGLAAFGYLPPVAGAITQEVIDVLAVLNAIRASITPRTLSDQNGTE